MGRKAVPFVDENALLRMRLRAALEDEEFEISILDDDSADDDRVPFARNRLIGLLHGHRAYRGTSIVVLTGATHAAERERRHDGMAAAWIVKRVDESRFTQGQPLLVH